jgi:hypothetical protein
MWREIGMAALLSLAGCIEKKPNPELADMAGGDCARSGRNGDCPSGLCWDDGGKMQQCIESSRIAYVSPEGCPAKDRLGTRESPFCEVQTGIDSGLPYVFLQKPGSYQAAKTLMVTGPVTIIGPWAEPALRGSRWDERPAATILPPPVDGWTLQIQGQRESRGDTVVVDGVEFNGEGRANAGIEVQTPSQASRHSALLLRRTVVRNMYSNGVVAGSSIGGGPAELSMDRCKILGTRRNSGGNGGTGLQLGTQTKLFDITNTLIARSGAVGVALSTGVLGSWNHNTMISNGDRPSHGAMFCDDPNPTPIRNSIIFGNQMMGGYQIDNPGGRCGKVDTSVVGQASMPPGILKSPMLEMDGRLVADHADNRGCCIDAAAEGEAPRFDYLGTLRPQGAKADIGFHEVQ